MSKISQHIHFAVLEELAALRKTNTALHAENKRLKKKWEESNKDHAKEYGKMVKAVADLTNALYDLLKAGEKKAPEKKFKAKNLYDKKLWSKAWKAYDEHGIPF